MNDGRKYTRRRASDYLLVTDADSGLSLGRIINMSPKGVMIMSAEALSVSKPYRLNIKLPVRAFTADNLELAAECRWSNFEKRSDLWESGLEINEISADNRRLLQQVVLRLMTHNGEWGESDKQAWGQNKEKLELVRVRRYRR